jgi:GT2 family glycosyltransferase
MTAAPCPVAVVVVAWNSMDYIGDCLDSLLALEQPPAEIVVVDNGSTDGTPEHIRDGYPAIRVIACGENIGYCRANNLGFDETASPLVLALNPDTRLTPHFLRELIPAFDDPAVGIAAGKLLRFDGRHLDSAGQLLGRSRQPLDRGYGDPDQGQYDENDEVFGACGAAALYRRAMLESIRDPETGYFDETFFAFYEDLERDGRLPRLGGRPRSAGHPRSVSTSPRTATSRSSRTTPAAPISGICRSSGPATWAWPGCWR